MLSGRALPNDSTLIVTLSISDIACIAMLSPRHVVPDISYIFALFAIQGPQYCQYTCPLVFEVQCLYYSLHFELLADTKNHNMRLC